MPVLPPTQQRLPLSGIAGPEAVIGRQSAQLMANGGRLDAALAARQPNSYAYSNTSLGFGPVQAPQPESILFATIYTQSFENASLSTFGGVADSRCYLVMDVEEFTPDLSRRLNSYPGLPTHVYDGVVTGLGVDGRINFVEYPVATIQVNASPGNWYRIWLNAYQTVRAWGSLASAASAFTFDFREVAYSFITIY
jgi:hypothetical protein